MEGGQSPASAAAAAPDCDDKQVSDVPEKDPRRIARKYQTELCKKALEENVIVYLGTGCGKTHISVLLIYEMRHLIMKPQNNKCIFLAPSVALVQQQAKVIEALVDFKVGVYCGKIRSTRNRHRWEKEIEECEVLVMTPQILLFCLSHCFIKMEMIALLIFDECHYAQPETNHPYAEIMKIFYKPDLVKLPRIFGMTASPILKKGGLVDDLEALMRAKVYSVEDEGELKQFVTSPRVTTYVYDSNAEGMISFSMELSKIKNQYISTVQGDRVDTNMLRIRSLERLHSEIMFCLENLGVWGALKAIQMSLKGELINTELDGEETGTDDMCKRYLHEASLVLASGCTRDGMQGDLCCTEALKEPFFSTKLLKLVEILSNFRVQPDMKGIIFVNRIVTARLLTCLIQNMKFLSFWKSSFLVGIHSGHASRRSTDSILEKFRFSELNLLVATKVGEEGLDIQTCCLVVRFDLPETVASFIQSRGRARMPQSEYTFLVNRGNPEELNLIEDFKNTEALMNIEISSRKSPIPVLEFNEATYKVDSTGATISSTWSISLLHQYCSSLHHDEYFNPRPDFSYYDTIDGIVCNIILPANAPVHHIESTPQPKKDAAKRDACLKACQTLHEIGALTDYLLPEQDENYDEFISELSDYKNGDDKESFELHAMLVPSVLRIPWTEVGDHTWFSFYYIKFTPNPVDRTYKMFGLFVKEPLPEEAGKMKLDLCLDNGRVVMTQLIPSRISRFHKDEIASAEKFQRMFLKIIFDRHEFRQDCVSLGAHDILESSSFTHYLLLPVLEHGNDLSVDWALIKRCLSSPIFKFSNTVAGNESSQLNSPLHLHNGFWSSYDILNSLVYVPCKNSFYFISDILSEKNAYDLHDESRRHIDYYAERFNLHLAYPTQPLLKAKQLFNPVNLLRKKNTAGKWREKQEFFVEIPAEICQLKIIAFSKDIGSSLSLLPSIMHRLENFLVAIELKTKLTASFPEGVEVSSNRILEALTTERCSEQFSLERLEVLGDAFLKFAVGRHLFLKHNLLDEGQLSKKRSNIISNPGLLKLAKMRNLQGYIRDQPLEPRQFFPFGRPCPVNCNNETEERVHSRSENKKAANIEIVCSKGHHWIHKKTIADVVEALVGAFIVDSGFKAATAFLNWFGIEADILPSQVDNICSASKSFLTLTNKMDVNALEKNLDYTFTHKGLLIQAFVHPSSNNQMGGCYQRLEFLGDAVLDYLITSYLYSVYPNLKPGHLTDLRSLSVSNMSLADVARRWSFDKFLICDSECLSEAISRYVNVRSLASAERLNEERTYPKALGDLVESCIGALFLDTGLDLNRLWKMILLLLNPIVSNSEMQINPLRDLTELCQSYNWDLKFSASKKDGKFCVQAQVEAETASATNVSGKVAKRIVARQLFERLMARGYRCNSKSLKEVLEETKEAEAKLIGYDEPPHIFKSTVQETSESSGCTGVNPVGVSLSIKSRTFSIPSPLNEVQDCHLIRARQQKVCNGTNASSQGIGARCGQPAKSQLYELCAAKYWKPPVFECAEQTGQDHIAQFTFKVVVEITGKPNETFEFYGAPQLQKKQAAENAAEGALWFFRNEGHIQ